ncbi:hypothetical protein D8682_00200 (plasmid) [Buttiauxella sp. 3AFRM03]|nr:hypothetical protein D8682_00200 [Buttiauxella sp. 3AFRM03]
MTWNEQPPHRWPLSTSEHRAYLRSSAPPACGNMPGLHPGNAPALRRAYLRSSAPSACGNMPGLHPGNAPALRWATATAQHHAAGAATVCTLNAGRICAAVRPLPAATCRG